MKLSCIDVRLAGVISHEDNWQACKVSELLFNFMPGDIDPQLEQTECDASLVCDDKAVRCGLHTSDQDREMAAGSEYEWRTHSRAQRTGLRLVK